MTSNCMNSSISYAQNVSQKELKQDYKEIVDDFVEMEEYDIKSGKTVSYKMKNYSDDEYFPATNGYKGTLFESNKLPLVEEGSYELKSIIGNDDRNRVTDTTRVPYRYIGQLIIQFEKPNKQRYNAKGTAFLVGKSSILTAAHCVYEKNDRVVSGTFYPAQNGTSNRPYTYTCGQIHIPTKYKTAINNNDTINSNKYDYALIKLNQSAGTTLGFFALGGYNTNYNANNLVGMEATVVGYPGEKAGMMYRHKGLIQSFNSDKYLMNYQMDTTAGQSGSPVILPLSGGRYYVVGIHILGGSTENSARYITKNIYELVKKYE